MSYVSEYDGKTYHDAIDAKCAEYLAETGTLMSREEAELIIDRETDAKNSAF